MRTHACLLSFLVASCCFLAHGHIPRRLVTKTLSLDNGIDWGELGPLEFCPDGSFAVDLQAKFEPYDILDTDETAFNALKLYCYTPEGNFTGTIMSTEGEKGQWKETRKCHSGFLTSMRARVLPPQGALVDDVAVQNMQMECDYGQEILTAVENARVPLGDWGEWSVCPRESAICGMRTQYEAPSFTIDDAGVCDMLLFCCALDETTSTPGLN